MNMGEELKYKKQASAKEYVDGIVEGKNYD